MVVRSKKCREARKRYLQKQSKRRNSRSRKRSVLSRGETIMRQAYDNHVRKVEEVAKRLQTHDVGPFSTSINNRDDLGNVVNNARKAMNNVSLSRAEAPKPPPGTQLLVQIENTLSSGNRASPLSDREHHITSQLISPYDSVLQATLGKLLDENIRTKNAIADLATRLQDGGSENRREKQAELDRLSGVVAALHKEIGNKSLAASRELRDMLNTQRGQLTALHRNALMECSAQAAAHAKTQDDLIRSAQQQSEVHRAKIDDLVFQKGVAEASAAAATALAEERATELSQQRETAKAALYGESALRAALDSKLQIAESEYARNRNQMKDERAELNKVISSLTQSKGEQQQDLLRLHEQLQAEGLEREAEVTESRRREADVMARGRMEEDKLQNEIRQGLARERKADQEHHTDLETVRGNLKRTSEQIVQLDAVIQQQQAEKANLLSQLQTEKNARNADVLLLRGQLESESRSLGEVQMAIKGEQTQASALSDRIDDLERQLSAERAERASLEQQLVERSADAATLRSTVNRVMENKNAVSVAMERLQQAMKDQERTAEQQAERWAEDVEVSKADKQASDLRIESLQRQLQDVEARSTALVTGLEEELVVARSRGDNDHQHIATLEAELNKARSNMATSGDELSGARRVMAQLEERLRRNEEVIETLRASQAGAADIRMKFDALQAGVGEKDAMVAEQSKKLLLAASAAAAQDDRLQKLQGAHEDVVQELELAKAESAAKLAETIAEAKREQAAQDLTIKKQAAELLKSTEHLKTMDSEHQSLKEQLQHLLSAGLTDQVKLDDHALRIDELMGQMRLKDSEIEAGREALKRGNLDWQAALDLKDQIMMEAEKDLHHLIKTEHDSKTKQAAELVTVTQQLQQVTQQLALAKDQLATLEPLQSSTSTVQAEDRQDDQQHASEVESLRAILQELVSLSEGRERQDYLRNIDWLANVGRVNSVLARERQLKQALRKLKSSAYVCVIVNTWDRALHTFQPLPASITVHNNTVSVNNIQFSTFYSADVWSAANPISSIYESRTKRTSIQDMVGDSLEGGSAVLFTYGLSGAGKTSALFGDPADGGDEGLMLCALRHLHAAGAKVLHESDSCLYGTFDVPSLTSRMLPAFATQMETLQHRPTLLVSNQLAVPGALHVQGQTVTPTSIYQTLKQHPAVKSTPNNIKSSRGHLFMTWRVLAMEGDGFLTFVDMAGAEDPKHIAEVYDQQALQASKNHDRAMAGLPPKPLRLDRARPDAFYDTMVREYKATDPKIKFKQEVHTILCESFFINETLNQLADFFRLERGQRLERPFFKIDGPWDKNRTNSINLSRSVYTTAMIEAAYLQDPHEQHPRSKDPDPVGFIRQLVRLKSLGDQSSVFTMVAVANPFSVSQERGVFDTLMYAQRL